METGERGQLALTVLGAILLIAGGSLIWGVGGGVLMAGAAMLATAAARL
jgi:LPXTG-motif cell wall-anchored protein